VRVLRGLCGHGPLIRLARRTRLAGGVSVLAPQGLDIHSPQFQAAHQACQKYEREASKYFPPG
jgi:hypothetical protein